MNVFKFVFFNMDIHIR